MHQPEQNIPQSNQPGLCVVILIILHVLYVCLLCCQQLTARGAAMLADGAVVHILDYMRFDCPENQGSYITVEALSRYIDNMKNCIKLLYICRSTVFARRSMHTANWLKRQADLPLTDPYDKPWNINGVFRLTGIRVPNGKYTQHT